LDGVHGLARGTDRRAFAVALGFAGGLPRLVLLLALRLGGFGVQRLGFRRTAGRLVFLRLVFLRARLLLGLRLRLVRLVVLRASCGLVFLAAALGLVVLRGGCVLLALRLAVLAALGLVVLRRGRVLLALRLVVLAAALGLVVLRRGRVLATGGALVLAAAAALGLTRQTTVLRVVLPACRRSLATAVVLAVVRALGETMAVLMVCGNVVQMPRSVSDSVRTLTAGIALEMGYAQQEHRAALFFCGLLLLTSVLSLVLFTELSPRRTHHAA